jgi:hypothetical protein
MVAGWQHATEVALGSTQNDIIVVPPQLETSRHTGNKLKTHPSFIPFSSFS